MSLHIASSAAAIMQTVDCVSAICGRGLEGDRYFHERGTYSNRPGNGRQITLIESEAFQALERDYGIALAPAQARRNIVTCSVALNHLVGKEFRVGAVLLRGMRLCDPCAHLERLSVAGALRGLIHRGGLRADVLSDGPIRVGDAITVASASAS